MLKAREGKPPQSADLLVCFPSRSHLALMPKPICSPARSSHHNKRRHHRRNRSISMLAGGGGGGQSSPSVDIAEPTSPKVTCAGQIKVRPKNTSTTACRSWQSVMEEIEKIHNGKKQRNNNKRVKWVESLGFKKEVMQFLTCLRSIRFDFRCFGSFTGADIVTDDDDDDEEEEEDEDEEYEEAEDNSERRKDPSSGDNQEEEGSRTVFSKWFMVLQEDQSSSSSNNKNAGVDEEKEKKNVMARDDESVTVAVPPRNALLLMRCRSAPAKSWLKREIEEEGKEKDKGKEKVVEMVRGKSLKSLMEEERRIINTQDNNNKLLVMYDIGISSDIAKETWIVGGLRETFSKTRSCKR
ncbi:hypothetical protein PIB30_056607 [Stylosanthes scabra]|uniref:Uncharacterized protein n=1 Tax=Stylosanthes scabra TaxID=79078 RepID=A0ABU6WJ98_9FABA|nr:hypothetical protein [Stylosanthes scabra]